MKKNKNLFIGIVALSLIGCILIIMLFKQQQLLKTQTQQRQIQINQQAELIESTRQSGLVTLMSHLLDKIDNELQLSTKRMLSDETITQIGALSYSFRSHEYLESDSVHKNTLSPERGHLLLMLTTLKIDSGSLIKIMHQASFSGAMLRDANLMGAKLISVDLSGADLQGANLESANLSGANLQSAKLWGANLNKAILKNANLKAADLRWAEMNGTDLQKADLHEADLTSAKLRHANLRGSILQWADFNGAFLNEANLDSTDLFRAAFQRAQLEKTTFSGAILNLANLVEANLTETNFIGTDLNNVVVSEKHWLDLISEWHVTNAKEIHDQYKMIDETSTGKHLYQLKKIE